MSDTPLIYTHDGLPGYRRRRCGRGFSYLLPDRKLLRDRKERQRIASLPVPPAYEDVWICMNPRGHLQATGIDDRGRKQYRYHPEWQSLAASRKFESLVDFARTLPTIRRRVRSALNGDGLERERIIAGVVALLDLTGFRIGGQDYARANRSFGIASLRARHVNENDDCWALKFRGKSGKLHEADIRDERVAALVDDLHELPGQHLFSYREDGKWRAIESNDVNQWLKEVSGESISAKQFRTWRATILCARALAGEPPPDSKSERVRARNQAIRETASQLNHTPSTCRKYYIHPAILRAWREGALHKRMKSRAPRLRKSDGSAQLKAEERKVFALIEGFAKPTKLERMD